MREIWTGKNVLYLTWIWRKVDLKNLQIPKVWCFLVCLYVCLNKSNRIYCEPY